MHRIAFFLVSLALISPAAFAQSDSPDTRVTQNLLSEIRQLRLDLQLAAATIQRVQIAMYRVQSETGLLERASDRLQSVRAQCIQFEQQRKGTMSEIERAEAKQREGLVALASQLADQQQQCQSEQIDAENQFRTEQAKMNDFQDQLSKLDAALAAYGGK